MNLIFWLLAGAAVGWLASALLHLQSRSLVFNVMVGVFGAFLAGWFVAPLAGIGSINLIQFSAGSIVVSLAGAALLLALVALLRAGRAH